MRVAAAVLAGGKASRLGFIAKGLLSDARGSTIMEHLIEELAITGIADIVISANAPQPYLAYGKPIIADNHPGVGPLGGIEAVLKRLALHAEAVIFVPCDLPNLTAHEMVALIHAYQEMPECVAFAKTIEGEHPLCAVVPVTILREVSQAIVREQYGVGRLWKTLGARGVRIDDSSRLVNLNTPEDLERWRQSSDCLRNEGES